MATLTSEIELKRLLASIDDNSVTEQRLIDRFDSARISHLTNYLRKPGSHVPRIALFNGLSRTPTPSLSELAGEFQVLPSAVLTEVERTKPGLVRPLVEHDDYRRSWLARHAGDMQVSDKLREVLLRLEERLQDIDLIAWLVGASESIKVREMLKTPRVEVLPEHAAGISDKHPASKLKHDLNDMLIGASGLTGRLVALELGQGVGAGTRRYQHHGLVVGVERDASHLRVAAASVGHLTIPECGFGAAASPLAQPPEIALQELSHGSYWPAIMFSQPVSISEAVKRLQETSWRFNWIDIDPMGFAEHSSIDINECISLASSESILCITNGGSHAERYGNRSMADTLASDRPTLRGQQRERRQRLVREHTAEVEAAYRVKQAGDLGLALHPILLFDGRDGPRGVVRTYYLLVRGASPTWALAYCEFDSISGLTRLSPDSIEVLGTISGQTYRAEAIPLLRFADVGSQDGRLTDDQRGRLTAVISGRLDLVRTKYGRK